VTRTWTPPQVGAATYGQTIAGIPLAEASVTGTGQARALRVSVSQSAGFRANLGLVNVSPNPVTVTVEIFTADGHSCGRQAPPGAVAAEGRQSAAVSAATWSPAAGT